MEINLWTERGIGFTTGIIGSIIASFLYEFIIRKYSFNSHPYPKKDKAQKRFVKVKYIIDCRKVFYFGKDGHQAGPEYF